MSIENILALGTAKTFDAAKEANAEREKRIAQGNKCIAEYIRPREWEKEDKKAKRTHDDYEDFGENSLRRQEAYAAYMYAGCTEGFWEDDLAQGGRW